ncbi:hypothetical protein ACFONG_05745 [Uliginosibacterium paludis]|uniref:BACON domain-containing protein n=1 Tax=Uliginosibacterium paludis TaxID=1615952 RepID=A0ABV2CV47_9RHOO
MWGILRLCLAVMVSIVLAACGGGGGGGGSSGGQADSNKSSGDFTLSASSLSFTAANAASLVASQMVSMSNIGSSVANVVVLIPQEAASWLSVTVAPGASYATVTVKPAGLSAGTRSTTVRVSSTDAAYNTLVSKDVTVTLTVGSTASSSSSSSVPAIVAWNSYDGTMDPASYGALHLAGGRLGSFTQIDGSIADTLPASASSSSVSSSSSTSSSASSSSSSASTAYFMDYMTINGDGTLRLDSSVAALNRSLIRGVNSSVQNPTYPRSLTFLARVLPVAGTTYDVNTRLAEFELAFGSSRVVLVLRGDANSGNVRLQTPQNGGSDLVAQLDMSQPHIFQVTVALTDASSGTINVYADGNPVPIIGPFTSSALYPTYVVGQDHIQFGDNRNVAFRSDLDWMIWTDTGAWTPAQMKGKLPSGLGVTTGY